MFIRGVHAELDEIRYFYDGLGEFFNDVGGDVLQKLAPQLAQRVRRLSIAYYPQLGCQVEKSLCCFSFFSSILVC